ncbi:hypothetical protein H0O00_01670 [Candidatus Micrarchaeota archaeon]|nr:hypothetical protein [Candidatus Micrarchaeota archaeon]
MTSLSMRTHPDVLFGFSSHHVELILRVENESDHPVWAEAEISVPENISLSPNNSLRKGRVRVGIIGKNEFLEKAVRVYSSSLTNPQMYKCDATLFVFNKDGVIDSRMEKSFNLRCELKKEATL